MQWYVYSHILAALISRVSGLRNWYPANPVLSWYPANPVPFDTPRIRFHIDIPRIRYLYWYPANPASILIPRESGSIDIPRIRLLYWYPANPVSMVMSRESGFYLVTPWTRFSSIDTPRIRSPHPVILRIRIRFLYIFMDTVCEPRESNSCLSRTANPVAISNPWLLIPSLISRESGLLYNWMHYFPPLSADRWQIHPNTGDNPHSSFYFSSQFFSPPRIRIRILYSDPEICLNDTVGSVPMILI